MGAAETPTVGMAWRRALALEAAGAEEVATVAWLPPVGGRVASAVAAAAKGAAVGQPGVRGCGVGDGASAPSPQRDARPSATAAAAGDEDDSYDGEATLRTAPWPTGGAAATGGPPRLRRPRCQPLPPLLGLPRRCHQCPLPPPAPPTVTHWASPVSCGVPPRAAAAAGSRRGPPPRRPTGGRRRCGRSPLSRLPASRATGWSGSAACRPSERARREGRGTSGRLTGPPPRLPLLPPRPPLPPLPLRTRPSHEVVSCRSSGRRISGSLITMTAAANAVVASACSCRSAPPYPLVASDLRVPRSRRRRPPLRPAQRILSQDHALYLGSCKAAE